LGMPPMNFLNGELDQRGDDVFVKGAGFDLRLDPSKAAAAKAHSDAKVVLGVRPSDITYAPDAAADQTLRLDVKVSEYIGAQSVLLCSCGPDQVTVEVASETPLALGETLTFAVNPARVHLFDHATEVAI
ncbi:MAG: TOBE domain-containing protein, partial [Pseudomonadota bacterium]